jgi:hypothetical protein
MRAYATDEMLWLAAEWEKAIPSAVFSGIVGDAAHSWGYHRAAIEIGKSDYSRQLPGDRDEDGIDMYAADAIDMSMSTADMKLVTRRIYDSWRDPKDRRLNYWRECIGTLDGVNVTYMDTQTGSQGTADDSHLWHVHAGGLRINAHNLDAMKALLSIVTGEPYVYPAKTARRKRMLHGVIEKGFGADKTGRLSAPTIEDPNKDVVTSISCEVANGGPLNNGDAWVSIAVDPRNNRRLAFRFDEGDGKSFGIPILFTLKPGEYRWAKKLEPGSSFITVARCDTGNASDAQVHVTYTVGYQ